MHNTLNKLKMAMYQYGRLGLLLVALVSVFAGAAVAQTSSLITPLCGLVLDVQEAVFIVALALLTLGGALYATAHILPAQQRGALQGYGMGMIIGGVVGVILVALAPFVVNQLIGTASGYTATTSTCSTLFGVVTFSTST